jgi:hypothetical protein
VDRTLVYGEIMTSLIAIIKKYLLNKEFEELYISELESPAISFPTPAQMAKSNITQ